MNQEQEHRAKMLLCALNSAKDIIGATTNLIGFMELDDYLKEDARAVLDNIQRIINATHL